MSLFEKLFGRTERTSTLSQDLVEAGVCPNCWGKQSYDGTFKIFVEDQTKAHINHDKLHRKTFVQQFIETAITGIRLKKEGDAQACSTCNGKYKYVPARAT